LDCGFIIYPSFLINPVISPCHRPL
jgi:hypothetical protein